MTSFRVRSSSGEYLVRVARSLQPALGEVLATLPEATRTVVLTDANVADLHLAPLSEALGGPPVHVLPPGESAKSPERLAEAWAFLRDAGCDRSSRVVALGGGVVGDLAGFAAATYMRGVPVVHLPTTLLAMVDSAIGGKTAVNLGAKNLVGAFHAPAAVLAHTDALGTLPEVEVRCGLGEVWKTAVLSGEELLGRVESEAAALRALDPEPLQRVILACLEHKAGVVERDEREAGERALLNLGHTLGHALEVLDPGLTHGEAVAVGGAFACDLAERLGWLEPAGAERLRAAATGLGLPDCSSRPLDADALLELVARDKKAKGGRVRWVLPRGPGRCEVTDQVTESLLRELLPPRIGG